MLSMRVAFSVARNHLSLGMFMSRWKDNAFIAVRILATMDASTLHQY